ncbi:transcription antitermination factor NusB [Candidatus Poribacteria bacterium]|nr:transcription antitermination factor NusB [Candidatus Poribacteria bacterium]
MAIGSEIPRLRPRTLARYFAATALYQFELTREYSHEALERFWRTEAAREVDSPVRRFATQLVELALLHLDTIDGLVEQYARQRALHRVPALDLALLRLGSAEMLYLSDVPPVVTINEIVELTKLLCADESAAFLNAVLDKIKSHREQIAPAEKAFSQWAETHANGVQ